MSAQASRIQVTSDAATLAALVATEFIALIKQIQATERLPQICLTGGRIANRCYDQILALAPHSGIDWGQVSWWWGDDRFVPRDSPERNEWQARTTLLHHLPIKETNVHAMPPSDGAWGAIAQAAEWYSHELEALPSARFDLTLLSVGEDGHVASLFPGQEQARDDRLGAIAIVDSPKPPSQRISLTLPSLNQSDRQWVLASGVEKATAVSRILTESESNWPAARLKQPSWFLDHQSASLIVDQIE